MAAEGLAAWVEANVPPERMDEFFKHLRAERCLRYPEHFNRDHFIQFYGHGPEADQWPMVQ